MGFRADACKIARVPRFEFDQATDNGDWVDNSTRIMNLVVRGFGLALLLVGIFVALMVISSAWALYDDPASIEAFALAIERGSNLDLTLSSAADAGQKQLESTPKVDGERAATPPLPPQPEFRFSYFAAWLIALLLLMLIGRLAIAAVRTGGELALYDVQVKKLARALTEERAKAA